MELKPFHESVVDAIERARNPYDLGVLGRLISETKIPKNHEAILTAWMNKGIEHSTFANSDFKNVGAIIAQQGAGALIDESSGSASRD